MSLGNQRLAYRCRQLKSARKINSTWFFNNFVNVKLIEHGRTHKIFHVTDIEKLSETGNSRSTLIILLFNLMNQSNKNMI